MKRGTLSAETVGLTGHEVYDISGISNGLRPLERLTVKADDKTFDVLCRADTPQEVEYLHHGGILQYVLRKRAKVAIPTAG